MTTIIAFRVFLAALHNSFLRRKLNLLLVNLDQLHYGPKNASKVSKGPQRSPSLSYPLQVSIRQELDFGQHYQSVEHPEKEEGDSGAEGEDELVHRHRILFAQNDIYLLPFDERLKHSKKFSRV